VFEREGILASGFVSSLYRSQRVYNEMISWEMVLMREKEILSSERKVIGSCCGFFSVVADDDAGNDCW